ncbi:hypothetical protein PCG10_005167 [Penicillium crustosum]|uniref:LEA domain protein n=1 Tax=Penicillium crustosum TaxID=36656 RepID=A0A9P5GMW1_PENCR|nr:uncharacterized protein N7487_002662 [Penicillium crustosum]KAF7525282.1 hypothetical protein PCG10_005167 [Penicillium crustosum]KAJ5419112.1 hypothetical protein N7487_002662 [Penicillium crustosum]
MSASRFAPLLRTRVAVQTAPGFQAIRSISATAPCNKGPVDATKETLKKADRTVSDVAVKGINTGEKAANKIKDAVGSGAKQAREKGEEVKGEASEYAGKAKGEAAQYAGKVKGEAAEYAGKGKGKAEEVLGEAKQKTK